MISFDAALDCVRRAAQPVGTELIPVDEAAGRVLAAPVVARLAAPRCDVSAMDGYAVRDADLAAIPAELRVIGQSFAGRGWAGAVEPGQCIRIFTGAPVPAGADRVVIQENVRRQGDVASIDEHPGHARHIRKRGSDFETGEQLLPAGRLLDSRAIVAAAGADLATLEVFARPRLFIVSTGDELAEPGTAVEQPDAVPESVSFGVAAMASEAGANVVGRQRLADDLGAMEQAAARATQSADVVIVTGGASVGEKDFAKRMFEPLGMELLFSKVSIKPGKPVWFGRVGRALVMGLPGNPTSALVTARLLMTPLLAGLSGRDAAEVLRWRTATLASSLNQCGGRETFHRARLTGTEVEILSFQDSSAQRALADADVLVRQRANTPPVAVGGLVELIDF
jgi:molybdopterin molybdotransferase